AFVKRDELRFALLGDRKRGDEILEGLRLAHPLFRLAALPARIATHQHITAERLAAEEQAAREAERGVEFTIERSLEATDVDSESAQQLLGHLAVKLLGRLDRLAAAVSDQGTPVDRELVALGVAAEIVVVIENEDTRKRISLAIEPRRGEAADAAADHDQVVILLDRQAVKGKA